MAGDIAISTINGGPLSHRNAIINGNFAVAQRATSFVAGANNDDTYNLDRWYVLSDGNDVVDITQNTAAAPGTGEYCIALDVETTAKKFGIAQIVEAVNCAGLIGGNVTLSFKAKVSATTKLDNVKAAIVAWSGTADSVTSDIISVWQGEGTNPDLIANATYENTPANLNVTTSWQTYNVTANVDTANAKNIIVFIWSDVTDTTAGDFLYITDVQLEKGDEATAYERRPYGTELALCQRYCQVSGGEQSTQTVMVGVSNGTTTSTQSLKPYVKFRSLPTLSVSANSDFGWLQFQPFATGTPTGASLITANSSSDYIYIDWTISGGTAGAVQFMRTANTNAKLILSAEL